MFKVKGLFVLFLAIGFSFQGLAQMREDTRDTRTFWERMYFGGGFSLQLGNLTYIDVSPLSGYGITERLSVGIGGTYRYVNDSFWNYSYNIYGGRVFSRFGIIDKIFAHVEYEMLNWQNVHSDRDREWSGALFAGGGYSSHLGAQKGYQIYVLYNLTHDQFNSPYNEPYVIRFSLTF